MPETNGKAESQSEEKPSSLADRLGLSWLAPALKNKRTLKTWFRCLVVLLALLILMVVQKTLNSMGNAAFFSVYDQQTGISSLKLRYISEQDCRVLAASIPRLDSLLVHYIDSSNWYVDRAQD